MSYPARYFDGRTAAAHEVAVTFRETALVFAQGGETFEWRYPDLIRTDNNGTIDVWLSTKKSGSARLVICDPAALTMLGSYAPRLFHKAASFGRTLRLALILAAVTGGLAGALYLTLPQLAERAVVYVPQGMEAAIGENYREATIGAWSACRAHSDRHGQKALETLVARLGGADLAAPVTIDVIRMPIENAFALPGGHILITKKLIEKAQEPDEVAGVIAHELGHVIERHPMIGALENLGLNVFVSLLTGGGNNMVTSSAATLASLSYSRKLEARADAHGIAMLERAKISPLGFAKFFERLEDDETKDTAGGVKKKTGFWHFKMPTLLNSHPSSPERAALARKTTLAAAVPAMSTGDWAAVKAMCDGFTPGRPGKNAQSTPSK